MKLPHPNSLKWKPAIFQKSAGPKLSRSWHPVAIPESRKERRGEQLARVRPKNPLRNVPAPYMPVPGLERIDPVEVGFVGRFRDAAAAAFLIVPAMLPNVKCDDDLRAGLYDREHS